MDLERISAVLQNYNGQEESMQQVTAVLREELGENWTQTVFQDLQNLSPALKENLNHAFNYYAATAAWNEVQSYLADEQLTRTPEIEERLPILKHWLDFFGAPGLEAYQELENRLTASETAQPADTTEADTAPTIMETEELPSDTADEPEIPEDTPSALDETELDVDTTEPETNTPEEGPEEPAAAELIADETDADPDIEAEAEPEQEQPSEVEKSFAIEKIEKQLSLLEQNQAWLSARCVQLKNIEIYAYPFYGFIVDLLRQVLKDMNAVLTDESQAALIDQQFKGGQEAFHRKKEAIEHDIELAEQNCESAVTALISDDVDLDEIKRTLGTIDENDAVEYIGPAPDGFELLDDETPLDENAIKKQYEKIEKMDALGNQPEATPKPEKNEPIEENTSQTSQKGVQRKLSFSLKKKKPTGDET